MKPGGVDEQGAKGCWWTRNRGATQVRPLSDAQTASLSPYAVYGVRVLVVKHREITPVPDMTSRRREPPCPEVGRSRAKWSRSSSTRAVCPRRR